MGMVAQDTDLDMDQEHIRRPAMVHLKALVNSSNIILIRTNTSRTNTSRTNTSRFSRTNTSRTSRTNTSRTQHLKHSSPHRRSDHTG